MSFFVSSQSAQKGRAASEICDSVIETGCQAFKVANPVSVFFSLQTKQRRNQGKGLPCLRSVQRLTSCLQLISVKCYRGSRHTHQRGTVRATTVKFSTFSSYQHYKSKITETWLCNARLLSYITATVAEHIGNLEVPC